jgi:hypothetical protein
MSNVLLLLVVGVALLIILGLLVGGVMLLVRLGVIAHYATKAEEPAAGSDYSLDQSQEAGE